MTMNAHTLFVGLLICYLLILTEDDRMISKLVTGIANVRACVAAVDSLSNREPGQPGIGLIYGEPGLGKTATTRWLAVKIDAVFVTAKPLWTPTWMLSDLVTEMGGQPRTRCQPMFDCIARGLSARPRTVFVDEADAISDKRALQETLRVLHDLVLCPLVLIGGRPDFRRSASLHPQLERRVLREVEFKPAMLDDARLLARELSEVQIDDELIAELHRRSAGAVGEFVNQLAAAESWARRRAIRELRAADYAPNRPAVRPKPNTQSETAAQEGAAAAA